MHILPMEHVVYITPALFIVLEVVNADRLSGPPVTFRRSQVSPSSSETQEPSSSWESLPVDELAKDHRIALIHVHIPFMQPTGAVGGARDRGAHLAGKVVALVDAHIVTSASKSNGDRKATDTTADDSDVKLSPTLR